jgi:hypothetical protein
MRINLLLVLYLLAFSGCEKDGSNDPTVFSGVVLFANNMEPAGNVELRFVATKSDFPVEDVVEVINFRTPIDTEDGAFEGQFEGGLGIDRISINVRVFRDNGTSQSFASTSDGLFCNGGSCFEFSPGVTYDNMIILVPRLED